MEKTVFVKNPSGRIVDVPESVANEVLGRDGYTKANEKEIKAAKSEIYGKEKHPRISDADKVEEVTEQPTVDSEEVSDEEVN